MRSREIDSERHTQGSGRHSEKDILDNVDILAILEIVVKTNKLYRPIEKATSITEVTHHREPTSLNEKSETVETTVVKDVSAKAVIRWSTVNYSFLRSRYGFAELRTP